MNKKDNLEIRKAPEELTEQDLEKVNGGFECPTDDELIVEPECFPECPLFQISEIGCIAD